MRGTSHSNWVWYMLLLSTYKLSTSTNTSIGQSSSSKYKIIQEEEDECDKVHSRLIKFNIQHITCGIIQIKISRNMHLTLIKSKVNKTRESFHEFSWGFSRIPLEYLRQAQSMITHNHSTKAKQFPVNPSLKHAQFLIKLKGKLSSLNH